MLASPSFRNKGYTTCAPIGHHSFAFDQWNVAWSLILILPMCMDRQPRSYINKISLIRYIRYVLYIRYNLDVYLLVKPMLKLINVLLLFNLLVSVERNCSVSGECTRTYLPIYHRYGSTLWLSGQPRKKFSHMHQTLLDQAVVRSELKVFQLQQWNISPDHLPKSCKSKICVVENNNCEHLSPAWLGSDLSGPAWLSLAPSWLKVCLWILWTDH